MPKRGLLFLSMVVWMAGCVWAAEPKTLRFGVILSASGELAASGRKALAGVRMRMEELNRRTEATGVRLEMVFRDDESSAERAVACLRELATTENIHAVVGPLSTDLMLAMRDAARDQQVVLVSPSVTSPKIGKDGDWCFRVLFDDEFQGVALARFARGELGVKRAGAIVNARLAYANSVFASFKKVFEEEGGEMVREERYEWIADEDRPYDFSGILARIADIEPDIVLLPGNSIEVATIIRESLAAGLRTTFCGGDTWQSEHILLASGNNVEGSYFISGINFGSGGAAMTRWLDLFDLSHDPDAQPTSVLGYDALSLLVEAMKNGEDGPSVHEGMYAIRDFEIATGTVTIDRSRGTGKSAFIHKVIKDGSDFTSIIVGEIKP